MKTNLTLAAVRGELAAVNIAIRRTEDGEFRVNFAGGPERTAAYCGDLGEALGTGLAMAREGDPAAPRIPAPADRRARAAAAFARLAAAR